MSTAENPGVALELEEGADPIRGSIVHPDGSRKPFWGWLELMEELRRVAANNAEISVNPSRAGTRPAPELDGVSQPRATTSRKRA